jgi:hypothetical protein
MPFLAAQKGEILHPLGQINHESPSGQLVHEYKGPSIVRLRHSLSYRLLTRTLRLRWHSSLTLGSSVPSVWTRCQSFRASAMGQRNESVALVRIYVVTDCTFSP